MAVMTWSRQIASLANYWPLRNQAALNKKAMRHKCKDGFENSINENKRFIMALKNGGIWLS